MIYVELQRARRLVTGSAIVLAIVVAAVVGLYLANHEFVRSDTYTGAVPDSVFGAVALFGALVAATIAATSLSRESPTLPIVWTKPRSRGRIALEYFAVDLAAVAAVALLTGLAAVLCFAPLGLIAHVVHDPKLLEFAGRNAGIAFMWYAVVQAATAGLAGRAGVVAGLSWPVFSGMTALAVSGIPGVRVLALAINVVNPLAWTTSSSHVSGGVVVGTTHTLYPFLPDAVVVAAPWLLGALALYLATAIWSRREA